MVELIAKSPCDGLTPVNVGPLSLVEQVPSRMTLIAPYKGKRRALGHTMQTAHHMPLPSPEASYVGEDGQRLLWFGMMQFMLVNVAPAPELAEHAALTDQTDAWAVLRLDGLGGDAALARLVPVDLRLSHFPVGRSVRTVLKHMNVSVTRVGADAFEIMAFRSMAESLVADIGAAMRQVVALG